MFRLLVDEDASFPSSLLGPVGKPATIRANEFSAALTVPRTPNELASRYDLTISLPTAEADQHSAFRHWLCMALAERGLQGAVIHNGIVHEAIRKLDSGTLTSGFHLDYFALWHVPDDPYARLAQAVRDSGGRSINSPARARTFTDKATAHVELARLGLGVPATVFFRPWTPDRALTEMECAHLRLDVAGTCLFVKPSNGFSGRGIVRLEVSGAEQLKTAVAAARDFDRADTFLIQREVRCPSLRCDDGLERPAYWRVLYCLGDVIPFWWSNSDATAGRPRYRWLSARELSRFRLQPLLAFVRKLRALCQLDWFSAEICLSEGPEASCYTVCGKDGRLRPLVAIDYINDQCDVDVQSRWPGAPPDAVVRYVAERFADAAGRVTQVSERPQVSVAA